MLSFRQAPFPIIVVAGRRVDGSDTFDELEQLTIRILGEEWRNEYGRSLSIVQGAPLLGPEAGASNKVSATVLRLSDAIAGRRYVFHNNTSATLLEAVLESPIASTCRGITYTCGPCLRGRSLVLGANARRNTNGFFEVVRLCASLNVPLVFVHGSLSQWSRHTLTQLPGWAEIMLLPVADLSQQLQYQKMTRFGMAMPLVWAFRAYGAVTKTSGDALRTYARTVLEQTGYAPVDGAPAKSDDWTKWAVEEEEDYDDVSPDAASSRFGSIAANLQCPLSNTVGDVCGCIFDDHKQFIAVEMSDLTYDKAGRLTAQIGAGGKVYIVAWAEEEALLQAWGRVRVERQSSEAGSFEVLDEQLKTEWKAYSKVMEHLLSTALEHHEVFATGSDKILKEALGNLRNGEMAKRCV